MEELSVVVHLEPTPTFEERHTDISKRRAVATVVHAVNAHVTQHCKYHITQHCKYRITQVLQFASRSSFTCSKCVESVPHRKGDKAESDKEKSTLKGFTDSKFSSPQLHPCRASSRP